MSRGSQRTMRIPLTPPFSKGENRFPPALDGRGQGEGSKGDFRMKEELTIDINTLLKYDKAGPRYSSDPTAPVWNEEFGPDKFRDKIIETNREDCTSPLSLYFHIPFCHSLCFYCGCNSIITRKKGHAGEYISYLKREMENISRLVNRDRRVVQLHWGGGSPDFLSPSDMKELYGFITDNFTIDNDAEAGVELDPRETTFEHVKTLKGLGFNRISMGIQDFNQRVQEAVNRIQSEETSERFINWCRDLGFESINVDLIYGLPFQTAGSFTETVDRIIDMNSYRN